MSPDHGSSRSRRGVWSHWVPLAVTLTVATVGVAAWVWSQRKDEDEDDHISGLDYDNQAYGADSRAHGSRDIGSRDIRGPEKPPRPEEQSHGIAPADDEAGGSGGWGTRMSGALRRTPSPQQFFDSTGKTVAAGVAAASAAMGKALASIREEDKSPYGETNPWSEEADAKKERAPATASSPLIGGRRRKTVAIVVSADTQAGPEEEDAYHEHASILSHISRHNDFSKIKLFVLIYAPGLKDAAMDTTTSNLPPTSLSSSFSNIGHDQAQTPGDEAKNPLSGASPAFNSVYSEALSLVEKETMVLPFTTPNGHVHILRHLQPEVIYLQKSLSGEDGSIITTLQTWLRHDVILVVGADGGSGGLADSESEAERAGKSVEWWQRPERVGRGRGVVVVDSMRLNDDWARRVQGQE
ncbi:peroxin Pex22 [Fusarium albosuccineum]|uniref:Peroxin Pex22 n=1 Tax=Fusarium albosuccineum TaxID=1237068 RepID=A0A8H4LE45_9HYPO|nr:peroxin Pex22 [Fusarium albosuccineum]